VLDNIIERCYSVYRVAESNNDVEVTKDENSFFEELSTQDDDELLACEVSDEMYEKIAEKFGIGSAGKYPARK